MLNNINYETFWHNTLCRINHWERRHRGVSMISRNHFARTFLVIWHIYGILIMSWSLSSSRFVFRLYVLSTVHHSIHLCVLFLYIYIYSWSIFNSLARISIFAKKKKGNLSEDRSYLYLSVWKNWSNEPCHDTLRNVSMENEIRWNYIIYLWMKNCHLNLFYS